MNDATNLGDFYVKYFLKICLLKCFIVINFTVMKVVSGFFFSSRYKRRTRKVDTLAGVHDKESYNFKPIKRKVNVDSFKEIRNKYRKKYFLSIFILKKK